MKNYNTPEIKVIRFEKTEDVIQASGGPAEFINGIVAASYGAQDFSIFANNQ